MHRPLELADPYGKPTATTGVTSPFGYTGQYTDTETGYQYLRARYYDPTTGQFLSRDPAVGITRLAYGYTYGDPLNHADRNGLWPLDGLCVQSSGDDDSCNSVSDDFRNDHPEVAQQVTDFSGGVLDVNPITAPLNLDLTPN